MVCKAKNYGALGSHPPEVITQNENYRFVTDEQIARWEAMANTPVQFMSMVFRRSSTQPDAPVGGSFSLAIPDGGLWTNTPLASIEPLWVSTRLFTDTGEAPQQPSWTYPVLFVQHGTIGSTGTQGPPGADGIRGPAGVNGAAGVNGTDGTSLRYIGESATPPLDPEDGDYYYNSSARKSFVSWDNSWYQMTVDGLDGTSGNHNAIITLYQIGNDILVPPSDPTGSFTYDFTTATLTEGYDNTTRVEPDEVPIVEPGSFNGWAQTPPVTPMLAGEFIWAIQISAVSADELDIVRSSEFSGAVIFTGIDGLNTATVYLYKVSTDNTTPPVLPTGTFSFSFDTYLLTGGTLNGWTSEVPDVPVGSFLWMIQATASSNTKTDFAIDISEFSAPVVYSSSGNHGLSIVWLGDAANANDAIFNYWGSALAPQENWAYRDTDNKLVYIYNGTAWELMVLDGNDGAAGAPGENGLSVYITYNDTAVDASPPATPTGDGTANGWHTTPTAAVNWMSQKVAADASSGTWGAAILIRGNDGATGPQGPQGLPGEPGTEGPRGSNSFVIEESATGTTYTDANTAVSWAGSLTDIYAREVVNDIVNYFAVDGALRPNDKITVIDASAQISATRVWFGPAVINLDEVSTKVFASLFSGPITEVIDGNLLINGSVSADHLGADVISAGKINSTLLTSVVVTSPTIQTNSTATTTGGIQMTGQTLTVYDNTGAPRVKLGLL